LHQSAGSQNVLEIHGSLFEVMHAGKGTVIHRFERDDLARLARILRSFVAQESSLLALTWRLRNIYPLDWLGQHRPNLVLFGDALAEPAWSNACRAAENCDVLISVGTSGAVYPAAMLPSRALEAGATVINVDPQPCGDCWLEGPAGTLVPKLVEEAFPAGL
jgi:NAD-dependent deacetylase